MLFLLLFRGTNNQAKIGHDTQNHKVKNNRPYPKNQGPLLLSNIQDFKIADFKNKKGLFNFFTI